MPELPEVETILRRLKNGTSDHPAVIGQKIQSVHVTWERIIAEPDALTFIDQLNGKQIIDATRRGKFLHFPLNQGHLLAHLRMSGDMRMEPQFTKDGLPKPVEAYDRVVINFSDPWRLVFSNIRKFGRMWYTHNPQTVLGCLGPEPLCKTFTKRKLYDMLQTHNRQIKPLVMDQTFIAGLGNIYTDEALFRAKIHPLRKSDTLTPAETTRLHHAIQQVLIEGIQSFGSSLDWVYRGGQFQNTFQVYGRAGQPCLVCGGTIEKITVGQRGTHYCPKCQFLDHQPGV